MKTANLEKVQGDIVEDFEMGRRNNYWISFQSLEPPGIIHSYRKGTPLSLKSLLYLDRDRSNL